MTGAGDHASARILRMTVHRWPGLATVAAVFSLVAGTVLAPAARAVPADYPYTVGFAIDRVADCLARLHAGTNVQRLTGPQTTGLRPRTYPPNLVYDLRGAHWPISPSFQYPANFENGPAVANVCIVGGVFRGTVSRELSHREVYLRPPGGLGYSGAALRVSGDNGISAAYSVVLDGQHVSDASDAYRPVNNGFVLANAYSNWARDDCIENDNIAAGVVYDSLLENCYVGLSERPGGNNRHVLSTFDTGQTVIADSLLGLGFQPYTISITGAPPRPGSIVDGNGVGNLFKWSPDGNHLVLRNDVLLVPWPSVNGPTPMAFPPGTTAQNVTLVWLGHGHYPARLAPGVRVTTDIAVWDRARRSWLERHGCDVTGEHCTRQSNPSAPPPAPSPPPSPAHPIHYVGRIGVGSTLTSTSTVTIPVSRPVAHGDSLFVSVASSRPTADVAVSRVTDSKGDAYTIVRQSVRSTVHVALASAIGVAELGPGDTVEVSFAAPVNRASVTVDAFSGVAGLDQTAAGTGTSTAVASEPATTLTAGDVLFAAVGLGASGVGVTPGTGFTALPANEQGGRSVAPMYRTVPPGTYSVTASLDRSVDWGVVLASYVPELATGTAPPGYVGRVGVGSTRVSTSTITVPVTTPVTAGDSLFVSVSTNRPTAQVAVSRVTDSKGDAYTVAGQGRGGGSHLYVALASAVRVAALGTDDRITVSLAAPVSNAGVTVDEFSGVGGLEQATLTSGSSATVISRSVEASSKHALLFAAIGVNGSELSLTPGAGYAALASDMGGGRTAIPQFRVVSAAGSYSATATLGSSRDWGVVLGAYR